MSKCHLYSWGANSHGQLGLGYQSEQSTIPQEVDLSKISLDPGDIEKIVGGAGHTLILDKKGRVYSCGWNSKGQTGQTAANSAEVFLNFRRVNFLQDERIKDIACGWDGSMALTENGHLYVWGSNCYGQLGKREFSNDIKHLDEPDKITGLGEGIKAIAMGLRHSAVVTGSGKLLVSGSGSKCQLGILDDDNNAVRGLKTFTQIAGLEDVRTVACGQNHTVAVRKNGEIYCWGDNKHGQLGFDNEKFKKIDYPRKLNVTGAGEIGELRVGWTHTSFLNVDDGKIFSWGRNTYGQLGHENDEENVTWIPKCIPFSSKIRKFSVGSEHNVALTEDDTVLSWGWNEHGNCGNGSTRDVLVPETVKVSRATKAILVGSGAGHSFAIFTSDD